MKISRADAKAKQHHIDALRALWQRVPPALAECRAEIKAALLKANKVIEDYNTAVAEARGFAERVGGGLQEAWEEKSERWQEDNSDVADWIEGWNTHLESLDPLDCIEPELSILPNDTPAFEVLEGLDEYSS